MSKRHMRHMSRCWRTIGRYYITYKFLVSHETQHVAARGLTAVFFNEDSPLHNYSNEYELLNSMTEADIMRMLITGELTTQEQKI